MNHSISSINQQPPQELQQIIKLKVELTKQKSKLQGYKEMQTNYKKLTIKSEVMEKQLTQYQKIMETFFEKLKKLMSLLDIDYIGIFGANNEVGFNDKMIGFNERTFGMDERFLNINESGERINDSNISFTNLKPALSENPTLMRRINKLNSLKSISREYISPSNIQFTHEDAKFQLIQNAVKSLIRSNQQYQSTLQKYQKSSFSIEMNAKEQQVIVKRLESQIRMKDKEIEERDCQIAQLLKRISEMRDEMQEKQETIARQEMEQRHIVKTYEQLQDKILQLRKENSQQDQTKNLVRAKCHQLIAELSTTDQAYLKNYLLKQNLAMKSHTFQNRTLYKPEWYSESGKQQKYNNKSLIPKNKYQLVFD